MEQGTSRAAKKGREGREGGGDGRTPMCFCVKRGLELSDYLE